MRPELYQLRFQKKHKKVVKNADIAHELQIHGENKGPLYVKEVILPLETKINGSFPNLKLPFMMPARAFD